MEDEEEQTELMETELKMGGEKEHIMSKDVKPGQNMKGHRKKKTTSYENTLNNYFNSSIN